MILYRGAPYADVLTTFKTSRLMHCVEDRSGRSKVDTVDSWRALYRAVQLGWFVAPGSDAEPMMDVQELAHYSRHANGRVHLLVPGELIFFPTPADLSEDREWTDHVAEDGSIARRFSARFYANLFEDLGVSAVACLGSGSAAAAAAAALAEREIEAVDLRLAADGSSLLRGLDALLSLARAAPGAVAVHSGDDFQWPRYLEALVRAFLMSRLGFDAGAAGAWLAMAGPWMLAGAGR